MIHYGKTRSNAIPAEVEITSDRVFVAANIQPFSEEIDGETVTGYEFDYTEYGVGEYIQMIAAENKAAQSEITDAQLALCDIYEALAGGN